MVKGLSDLRGDDLIVPCDLPQLFTGCPACSAHLLDLCYFIGVEAIRFHRALFGPKVPEPWVRMRPGNGPSTSDHPS